MDSTFMVKQDLTTQELQVLSSEMDKHKKSNGVAWLLLIFLGGVGAHRYYLGRIGTGLAMTFTLGGLGFWTLIDLFLLSGMINEENQKIEKQIINNILLMRKAKENDTKEVLKEME